MSSAKGQAPSVESRRAARHHPETDTLHTGEGERPGAAPLTTPVYATSTFVFENAAELERYQQGRSDKYIYSRYANPTVQAAEVKVAVLEGADAALVTSSGMAATSTALFGLVGQGDEVVCSAAIYGGTLHLMVDFLRRFGVQARFASLAELAAPEALIGPKTRVVWFESPINPTLRCVDIRRLAAACRARGVTSVIDNTFASPINQQPLAQGVDLVMHSATKYLNGHSDVTAGALAGSRALIERLQPARKLFGGVLEPASAYALARGMKTLAVRIGRQNATAGRLAEWLEADTRISRVFYPGLASHPDHAIARAQMTGFGGMVCFEVCGGFDAARRFYDRVALIKRAASLGGVESLCSLPVLTSQYGLTDEQLEAAGVTRGMVRLSVGLEHADDLIADLDQALGRARP
jgi:cystathionine beta-lyase/cystathionine gamma-synthase